MLLRSNEVWNVVLTHVITEVRVLGSELARSATWETKTPPKSAVTPRTMIKPRMRTIPVASPRRTPRRTIHRTGGSMAMENSHASSRMKRNVPRAWNAQTPMDSTMRNPITISVVRLALAGVMEIQVASPWAGSTGAGRRGCVASVTRVGFGSELGVVTASGSEPPAPALPESWRRSTEPRPNRSLTPTLAAYGPDGAVGLHRPVPGPADPGAGVSSRREAD